MLRLEEAFVLRLEEAFDLHPLADFVRVLSLTRALKLKLPC